MYPRQTKKYILSSEINTFFIQKQMFSILQKYYNKGFCEFVTTRLRWENGALLIHLGVFTLITGSPNRPLWSTTLLFLGGLSIQDSDEMWIDRVKAFFEKPDAKW